MSDAAITIVIADDHPVVRAGLRALLDRDGFAIVGEASSGEEAVAIAKRLAPQIILLDFTMRGIDGPSATRALVRLQPSARVVLLVTFESENDIARGLAAGAAAVIAKDAPPSEIVATIHAVCNRHPAR